jgi:hypothetical protein
MSAALLVPKAESSVADRLCVQASRTPQAQRHLKRHVVLAR